MKVIITLESLDPLTPAKVSKPMHADEAVSLMREVIFRLATGEYAAVYVTREKPLKVVV